MQGLGEPAGGVISMISAKELVEDHLLLVLEGMGMLASPIKRSTSRGGARLDRYTRNGVPVAHAVAPPCK
jgi:hypothetical protein